MKKQCPECEKYFTKNECECGYKIGFKAPISHKGCQECKFTGFISRLEIESGHYYTFKCRCPKGQALSSRIPNYFSDNSYPMKLEDLGFSTMKKYYDSLKSKPKFTFEMPISEEDL